MGEARLCKCTTRRYIMCRCSEVQSNRVLQLLGCAIILVIVVGCAKLAYTHWKLRKYIAIAEKEKQEQAMQRQMSQRQRQTNGEDADVPFGIRAIESGVEVEGVWISRNNTPEPVSWEGSPSSVWDHARASVQEIDVEKQEVLPSHDRSRSEAGSGNTQPSTKDAQRSTSMEQARSNGANQVSPPDVSKMKLPIPKHPPPSLSKFTGVPYVVRQDCSRNTLHGVDAVYHAAGTVRHHNGDLSALEESLGSNESSNQSTEDSGDAGPIAASAPGLLNTSSEARSRQRSSDLDLMHNHRLSQAAETGQLTPRARRPDPGSEWPSIPPAVSSSKNVTEAGDYFSQPRRRSTSPPKATSPLSAPLSVYNKPEMPPAALRRASLPNVMSFAQFCQTSPPLPQTPQPTPASPTELPASAPSKKHRRSFEHHPTRVLRGQGTGFEILRPGTLNPSPAAVEKEKEKRKSRPPVSLENGNGRGRGRSRSIDANSGRKLQKKRRSSEDSGSSQSSGG